MAGPLQFELSKLQCTFVWFDWLCIIKFKIPSKVKSHSQKGWIYTQ